ncbi:hypothetical protein CCP2SC5_80045 [Azospirillaceae bacterium]
MRAPMDIMAAANFLWYAGNGEASVIIVLLLGLEKGGG